ncbi:MAG: carbohydrate kinase [Lentisphaerae bacterium]|nr:carbohydrate kinase [Lentisphaerota bacterium]
MNTKIQQARRLVAQFKQQRILVIGDLMLDQYIYGTADRISPEAPVPVVRVREEKNMPGGAANVARNVQALGGHAILGGVVGQDAPGQELLATLTREGIATSAVIAVPGFRTAVKTRIIAERQQMVRVDCEDRVQLSPAAWRKLYREISAVVGSVDGVIIEDYSKGLIRQPLINAVLTAARRARVPVALDPTPHTRLHCQGLAVVTPNRKEALTLAGLPEHQPPGNPLQDGTFMPAARIIIQHWRPACLVITLGAQGMLVKRPGRAPLHIPTVAREVFDVSGAGDTVVAVFLLALAAGAAAPIAAAMATCAAGVVVGKVGTAVCTSRELIAFYRGLIKTEARTRPR